MKVLFLGPVSATLDFLRETEGADLSHTRGQFEAQDIDEDLIVSHNYRYRVPQGVLETTPAVNLHIGYLPWNRGAHPNFWSIYEGTPGGVTIHWMDEGFDTGPIIAQRRVEHAPSDTFATSYEVLQYEMTRLFKEVWPAIREGTVTARPQPKPPKGAYLGTCHRVADLPEHLLTEGWDTPVAAIQARGLEAAKRMASAA